MSDWKKGGGDPKRLSAAILKTANTLQGNPRIGHLRPDVTDVPVLFFPTAADIRLRDWVDRKFGV